VLSRTRHDSDFQNEEQRESTRQALRAFIDRVVIPPDGLLRVASAKDAAVLHSVAHNVARVQVDTMKPVVIVAGVGPGR
jgi:hypothetical protein